MKIEFDALNPKNAVIAFITGLIFLALSSMYGWQFRECQQIFFVCGIMAITALWMRNLWITGFILWSIVLYIYHRFTLGQIYLTNIFFGSVLYFFSLGCLKKDVISKYLNVFLWFVVLNLGYTVFQTLGYDPIFQMMQWGPEGMMGFMESNDPVGFMSFRSAMGMLMAIAIPVVMTRGWKLSVPLGFALMFPVAMSSATIAVMAGAFGILFSLWHIRFGKFKKWKKLIISLLAVAFLLGGAGYAVYKDDALKSFGQRASQWKLVIRDAVVHPISGWGMDSFRNLTNEKKWQYVKNMQKVDTAEKYTADVWDNPHNLVVSLLFEWGIFGVILVAGYFVNMTARFRRSERLPNTVALYGVCMVSLILSMSHFPIFLARFMCFLVPMAAMFENSME